MSEGKRGWNEQEIPQESRHEATEEWCPAYSSDDKRRANEQSHVDSDKERNLPDSQPYKRAKNCNAKESYNSAFAQGRQGPRCKDFDSRQTYMHCSFLS